MHKHRQRLAGVFLLLATLALAAGCATIGADKMPGDRTNYNTSLTESWKQQVLLNIVKIRYVEPLFFVDIGDIVAGYTMETGANLGFSRTYFDPMTMADSSKLDLGVSGKYTDRPTITYKPLSGLPFRRAVMSPMPLRNVALGIETGVSANFLVNLGVRSINGLNNEALSPQEHLPSDRGFQRAVELLVRLQAANAVHVRAASAGGKDGRVFLCLGSLRPTPEVTAQVQELQGLLDLDPNAQEYELVSTLPAQRDRRHIMLQTYSLIQIMANVAAHVDIPEEEVASQQAMRSLAAPAGSGVLGGVMVRRSETKPAQAFTAVYFHDHWFWVDDHDLATKRVFSFILLAFNLMEESRGSTPLQLTVPTQ